MSSLVGRLITEYGFVAVISAGLWGLIDMFSDLSPDYAMCFIAVLVIESIIFRVSFYSKLEKGIIKIKN